MEKGNSALTVKNIRMSTVCTEDAMVTLMFPDGKEVYMRFFAALEGLNRAGCRFLLPNLCKSVRLINPETGEEFEVRHIARNNYHIEAIEIEAIEALD